MNRGSIATFINATGTRSRRNALGAAGAAGLAAALTGTGDGVARKKKNKEPRCKKQKGLCTGVLVPRCNGDQDCVTRIRTCCALTATCDISGFLDCL